VPCVPAKRHFNCRSLLFLRGRNDIELEMGVLPAVVLALLLLIANIS